MEIPSRHLKFYIALSVIALTLYLALLVADARAVKPWNDEAMAADAAYNLSNYGTTGVKFFDEKSAFPFVGIARHTYYIFPFQLCTLAIWYKIAGFSLLSTRVISILWSLVGLGALYSFLKIITADRAIAGLATLLAALDYHMMTEAAFGRYDTMVSALGFSAYSLYVYLRERNFRLALLLSNACVMMAGATHPNGLVYLIGLWFLILYFDRKRMGWTDLMVAAVPYLAGAAIWSQFILQDFPSFRGQLSMNASGRVGILHPWDSLMHEIRARYITEFGLGPHSAGHDAWWVKLKALSLFAYFAGIIGCLTLPAIRKSEKFRVLLLLAGIHWAYMTFYENMKFSFYLVHLIPMFCALLALLVVTLWRAKPAARWALAGALALVGLVQVAGIAAKVRLNDYARSYLPAVEFVRDHASKSNLVAASCSFGFAYGFDRNLMDDPSLGYYNGRLPDYIVAEEIYDGWWQERESFQPAVYEYCMRTLKDYDVIYDRMSYRVYRRRALEQASQRPVRSD
jgi:hypothetical protein